MVGAAIIQQRGKVEYRDVHVDSRGLPPRYLRFARLTRPLIASPSEWGELETTTASLATVDLDYHRLVGFSVPIAYWHKSWMDHWAIEDLLRWEGRDGEADHFRENSNYNNDRVYVQRDTFRNGPENFAEIEPSHTYVVDTKVEHRSTGYLQILR